MTYDEAKAEFIKKIQSISLKYSCHQVFSDFAEMSAIAISNRLTFDEKREQKYMELQAKYSKEEMEVICSLLSLTADALTDRYGDFLGEVYMGMDNGNKHAGQFFTPYNVSKLCARIVFDKSLVLKTIEEQGYVNLNEPACGSCGMVIAWAEVLRENEINFQQKSLAIVNDIDYRCAYMSYIQLSLIGMPAVVTVGDTLTLEVWEKMVTPMYVLNKWRFVTNKADTQKTAETVVSENETPAKTNNDDTVTEFIPATTELQLALF